MTNNKPINNPLDLILDHGSISLERTLQDTASTVISLIEDNSSEQKTHPDSAWCQMRNALDMIRTIPAEVEKMLMYNMMVRANRLIDDPHTTFYTKLPDMLIRFGSKLNVDVFNPRYGDSLLWTLPSQKVCQAYPPDYFIQNPSLQIVWHDSETGQVKNFLVTVGLSQPVRTIGPVQVDVMRPIVSDEFISCTPIQSLTRQKFLQQSIMTKQDYKRIYMSKIGIPKVTPAKKREIDKMSELTCCDFAQNIIMKKQKVFVDVIECCT